MSRPDSAAPDRRRPIRPWLALAAVGLVIVAVAVVLAVTIGPLAAPPDPLEAGYDDAKTGTVHVVGELSEGGAGVPIEIWYAASIGEARRTQTGTSTWLDAECRGDTSTDRRHGNDVEVEVSQVYLDPADCLDHAADLMFRAAVAYERGDLVNDGVEDVDGRRAIRLVPPDGSPAEAWLIDESTHLLLRATFPDSPPVRFTYTSSEVVDGPPPAFDRPFDPVRVDRYTELQPADGIARVEDLVGRRWPTVLAGQALGAATEVRLDGAAPEDASIRLSYGLGGEDQVDVEVSAVELGSEELGFDPNEVLYGANINGRGITVLSDSTELTKQAIEELGLG